MAANFHIILQWVCSCVCMLLHRWETYTVVIARMVGKVGVFIVENKFF